MENRKNRLKGKNLILSQEKKRTLFLERQKEKRTRQVDVYRSIIALVQSSNRDSDNSSRQSALELRTSQGKKEDELKRKRKRYQIRDFFSKQLSTPEWMTEVPCALSTDWYVMARPEGTRCLVIVNREGTTSRMMCGDKLHSFISCFPFGTLLDCIYSEKDKVYYVLDVMCWRECNLLECTAEFRFYWFRTKLEEVDCRTVTSNNNFKFEPIPFFNSDQSGILMTYSVESFPYVTDGLLFYHKQGHYECGLTPLVLLWKDRTVSSYMAECTEGGMADDWSADRISIEVALLLVKRSTAGTVQVQECAMEECESRRVADADDVNGDGDCNDYAHICDGDGSGISMQGTVECDMTPDDLINNVEGVEVGGTDSSQDTTALALASLDGHILGDVSESLLESIKAGVGDILRCNLAVCASLLHGPEDELLATVDVTAFRKCSERKHAPDPWSKIYFYLRQRSSPIALDMLLSVT